MSAADGMRKQANELARSAEQHRKNHEHRKALLDQEGADRSNQIADKLDAQKGSE